MLIENLRVKDLQKHLNYKNCKKIFIVSGKHSYENCGAKKFIDEVLTNFEHKRFFDFEINPKYEDVKKGVIELKKFNPDVVIAIGGGSVLDVAKLISLFSTNENINILNIVQKKQEELQNALPLIAIPTTAGTGSESTSFAAVYHNNKKYSVEHKSLLPQLVGLRPEFTYSQSQYLTACLSLDAFSQAIESYWSINSTEKSRIYSKKSIKILTQNIEKVLTNPNPKNRAAIMKAAHLAGKAINISKTTAPHALSYAFTTYFKIPHGHAVWLTLPIFLEYNYNVTTDNIKDKRGVEYVYKNITELYKLLGIKNINEANKYALDFLKKIQIETNYSKLGINNLNLIIDNVNVQRLQNNPIKIDKNTLYELLKNEL